MRSTNWKLISLALLLTFMAACKKNRQTSWNTDVLVPIATASLSIQNLVKDSSVHAQADSSLILDFNSTLYEFNLADKIINIPDTSIGQKYTLSALALPNIGINYKMSLGAIANNMLLSPDPGTHFLGLYILAQNGNTTSIPALNNFPFPGFQFDASAYLDSAILSQGVTKVWAVNGLPIPITNITCELRNTNDNSLIATKYIDSVAAKDSVYFELPLAGIKIKNNLTFGVTSMSTPGSDTSMVLVDTTNFIALKVFVTDLKASEAWARFPAQNVVDLTEEVTQEIGERKFTYVDARSGKIHIFITSSVKESLYLEYTLKGAYDKFGHPVKVFTNVPAATIANPTVTIDSIFDISGTAISLTGKDGSKFNTYTQNVIAHIDSSGIVRHITNQDSINIRYVIEDVAPNYIKGYAGRDTLSTIDSSAFSFLDIFKSGSIDLEKVDMKFTVENGIGVDGQVKINSLTAISPNNGSRTLSGSVVGQTFTVNRATDFPLTPATSYFDVNSNNSNIKDLIGILPNKLLYDVEVKTNVNGNTGQYRDFAYLESGMKIGLSAQIPLSFIAHHLLLKDTIDFDLSNTNTDINGISDGIINVITQNKYPIDATLTMIIYDDLWAPVDTLVINQSIPGADLNNNCRAVGPKRTKIPVYVDELRMENVKRGKHAIVVADFNSSTNNIMCNGQYLKIYADYKLDITFTAQFNYKVNAKF